MSIKILNTPSPDVLMNSMRSIGYDFKTALADIVDNSISAKAKNIWIQSPINDEDLFISILDDGIGMSDSELLEAMKYGSTKENRDDKDLGRFGLGLKSASLSQCRKLTVASKREGIISCYEWDLDEVIKSKSWECIKLFDDEIAKVPQIGNLNKLDEGTLVVWRNFDIAYKRSGGHVREYLSEEIDVADKHLSLVFHRYLSHPFNCVSIYFNNSKLIPLDPFLESNPKTDARKPQELNVDGSIIKVQAFTLPFQNDMSSEDIEKLGGIESFRKGQGFYIYRNERLIIYGTWFRLSSSSISSELLKYGRIKVDIPNSLDDLWEIDVKKQNASIPKKILNSLRKEVENVCNKSKRKTTKRARLTLNKDDDKVWNKKLSDNNKDSFYINTESHFIKQFLEDFDDKDKGKIVRLLDIISTTIPFDDIYNSICNKNNEDKLSDDLLDSIVIEATHQIKFVQNFIQCSEEEAFEKVTKSEPFNSENVKAKIKEKLNNGN